MKKGFIFIALFLPYLAFAQCAYPDARSIQWKPMWLTTTELPRNGKCYYYDTGYGIGESYESALAAAMFHISTKREWATGQTVNFINGKTVAANSDIVVKARIEHEYWERCHDAVQGKQIYHVNILCIVAKHPDYDISRVRTNRKYFKQDKTNIIK